MHVYKPHEWDRVGWSPPTAEPDDTPPSKLRTAAAIALLLLLASACLAVGLM